MIRNRPKYLYSCSKQWSFQLQVYGPIYRVLFMCSSNWYIEQFVSQSVLDDLNLSHPHQAATAFYRRAKVNSGHKSFNATRLIYILKNLAPLWFRLCCRLNVYRSRVVTFINPPNTTPPFAKDKYILARHRDSEHGACPIAILSLWSTFCPANRL